MILPVSFWTGTRMSLRLLMRSLYVPIRFIISTVAIQFACLKTHIFFCRIQYPYKLAFIILHFFCQSISRFSAYTSLHHSAFLLPLFFPLVLAYFLRSGDVGVCQCIHLTVVDRLLRFQLLQVVEVTEKERGAGSENHKLCELLKDSLKTIYGGCCSLSMYCLPCTLTFRVPV